MEILYEDKSVLIIRKPAGLATQTADVRQSDCVSLIREHLRSSKEGTASAEPYLGIIHRLDQPVEGLLVFAKTRSAAAALSAQVRNNILNKHYTALVEGVVNSSGDTKLADMLYRDSKTSKAVIVDDTASEADIPAGTKPQKAVLYYRTEKIIDLHDRTILSICIETGRFHQIRAQLAHMGHPIVGDKKYGAVSTYPDGIALVADRLEFVHPDTGEKVEKTVDFSFAL